MRYLSVIAFICSAFMGQAKAWEELPIELFTAHSEFKSMQLSPDGKHIAFTFEEKDNEIKMAIITSDMKKITMAFGRGENKHVINPFWANNSRVVFNIIKNTGTFVKSSFNPFTVAVNVDGKKRRRLFDDSRRSGFQIINTLRNDPNFILVAKSHFTERGGIKINRLNINNGKLKYMDVIPHAKGRGRIVRVGVDNDGEVRIAVELDPGENKYDFDDDITTFHYKVGGAWSKTKLVSQRKDAKIERALGFNRDNTKYYFISNLDMPKNDTRGVFSFDFETKNIKLEFRHPDVDVDGAIRGPKGEVLGVNYSPGYPARHYFDKNDDEVKFLQSISASFRGENASVTSYTHDGTKAIVFVRSDRNPGDFYLYNRTKGSLRYLASVLPKIKPKLMSSVEAFTMEARDGVKLYGLLTLPKDKEAKNLPLIVIPHGGPIALDRWGYNPENQLLANRGYAVVQINFRGSSGYGEDFTEMGYHQWGRKMQDDITDATLWAIKEGIADKDRICIMGGSYGGYATLQGLVREPDLYKCGIGIVGVYSLPMMWTKGDVMEARRANYSEVYLNNIIGRDDAELKAYSPAFNVDKIKAPVFIIHGERDRRVPIEHAELLRKNLKKHGKTFEWLVKDEGHGFTQVKNRNIQYKQVLAFLEKYIGK